MKALSTLAVLCIIGGCSTNVTGADLSAVANLHITVSPAAVDRGAVGQVTFRNDGTRDVSVNPCGSKLERNLGVNQWTEIPMPPREANCADNLYGIAAGSSRSFSMDPVPQDAPAGLYRLRIAAVSGTDANGRMQSFPFGLTSETFQIR